MAKPDSSPVHPAPRRQQLRELLEQQKDSGLSIAAFARIHGLPPWRLYQAKSNRPRRRIRPDFVEVSIAPDPAPPSPLEVMLPDDITVRVPVGFDDLTLKRLLGALGAC